MTRKAIMHVTCDRCQKQVPAQDNGDVPDDWAVIAFSAGVEQASKDICTECWQLIRPHLHEAGLL